MTNSYSAGLLSVTGTLNVGTGIQGSLNAATVNVGTLNATTINSTNFGLQNLDLVGNLGVGGTLSVTGGINPPTVNMGLPGTNGKWSNFQGDNYLNQGNSFSSPELTAETAATLEIFRNTRIPSGYTQCSGWWHMICDDFYVYQLVLTCTPDEYGDNGSTGLARFQLVKYDRFTGEVVLSTLNNTNMWNDVVDASGDQVNAQRMKNIFCMNGEYLYFSSSKPNSIQGLIKVRKTDFNIMWTCSDPCNVSSIAINSNIFMNPVWSHGIFATMGIKHLVAVPHPTLAKQTILIFGTSTFDQYFTNAWDIDVRDIFTDRFNAYLQQGHVFAMLDQNDGNVPIQLWDFPLGPRILETGDELPHASFRQDASGNATHSDFRIAYPILYGPRDITGTIINSLTTSTDSSGNSNAGYSDASGAYFTFGQDTFGDATFCSFDHAEYDSIYEANPWVPADPPSDASGNYFYVSTSTNVDSSGDFIPIQKQVKPHGITLITQSGMLVDPYMFPKTWNTYTFTLGQTIWNDSTVYTSNDTSGSILGSDIFIGQNVVKRLAEGRILNEFDAFGSNYHGSGGYGVSAYDAVTQTFFYPCTNPHMAPYEDYVQVRDNDEMNVRKRGETYCGNIQAAMDASGHMNAGVISGLNDLMEYDPSNVTNADLLSPRWKRAMAGSTLALNVLTGALKYHYTTQAYDSFTWGAGDFPGSWPAYESLGNNNDNVAGLTIQVDASGNRNGFMQGKNGIVAKLEDISNFVPDIEYSAINAAYLASSGLAGAALTRYNVMCLEGVQHMTTPVSSIITPGLAGAASAGGFLAATNNTHYCCLNNNEGYGTLVFTPGASYPELAPAVPFSTEFVPNLSAGYVCRTSLLNLTNTEVGATLMLDVGTDASGNSYSIIPTGTRYVIGVNCTTFEIDWITPLQDRPTTIVGLFALRYAVENSGCTMSENLVYAGGTHSNLLNVLDSATGEVVKIIEVSESTEASVIAVGNVLYMGCGSVRWYNWILNPDSAGNYMRMLTLNGL